MPSFLSKKGKIKSYKWFGYGMIQLSRSYNISDNFHRRFPCIWLGVHRLRDGRLETCLVGGGGGGDYELARIILWPIAWVRTFFWSSSL